MDSKDQQGLTNTIYTERLGLARAGLSLELRDALCLFNVNLCRNQPRVLTTGRIIPDQCAKLSLCLYEAYLVRCLAIAAVLVTA